MLHSANTLINLSETRKKYQHNDKSVRPQWGIKFLMSGTHKKVTWKKSDICYRIVNLIASTQSSNLFRADFYSVYFLFLKCWLDAPPRAWHGPAALCLEIFTSNLCLMIAYNLKLPVNITVGYYFYEYYLILGVKYERKFCLVYYVTGCVLEFH